MDLASYAAVPIFDRCPPLGPARLSRSVGNRCFSHSSADCRDSCGPAFANGCTAVGTSRRGR